MANALSLKGIEAFFPTFKSTSQHGLSRPFFPGYVLSRFELSRRLPVIEIPQVIRVLGIDGKPSALPDEQVESVRLLSNSPVAASSCPFLAKGDKVTIKCGPLNGLTGYVVRFRNKLRVVCSIEAMNQSIMTDISVDWLRQEPKGMAA